MSKLGEKGYEVEWCYEIAFVDGNPEYGIEPDKCKYAFRDFPNRGLARAFAKKIFPKDQFGAVRITPFEIMPQSDEWPYGKTREHTGDSEMYEGESQ